MKSSSARRRVVVTGLGSSSYDAFAAGERYLPETMPDRRYYRPVPRGLEIKIGEALARLRARNDSKG